MESDKLTITVNGASKEYFMSFGVLNEITKVVGDIDSLGFIMIDTGLREAVLREVMSSRDDDGKITKEVNLMTTNISPDDVNALLAWVSEHLLAFFMNALEKSAALGSQMKERLRELGLMSSPTGSPA